MDAGEILRLHDLNAFAWSIDGTARVLIKDDSRFMRFLAVLVRVFNPNFMAYATTIGNRIYVPRSLLPTDLRRLLVHEIEHVQQCRALGFWLHPWLGFPIYMLLYLILPFPIGLAFWRYWYEREAEARAWRWGLDCGESPDSVRDRCDLFSRKVGSWDYFRPWPRAWVVRGFRRRAEEEIAEPRKTIPTAIIQQSEMAVRGAPSMRALGISGSILEEVNIKREEFDRWWDGRTKSLQGSKGREPEIVIARQAWDAGWLAASTRK
jgi:hypothetical protein